MLNSTDISVTVAKVTAKQKKKEKREGH